MSSQNIDVLIRNLESQDKKTQLEALTSLKMLAKASNDIRKAIKPLNALIKSKDKLIWKETADTLSYYHQHWVSFYCRNYGSFPEKIKELYNLKSKVRESAALYLDGFPMYSKPREWKYLTEQELDKLIKNLNSENINLKKRAASELSKASEQFNEITPALESLEKGLIHENEEFRWACADALGFHISNYMNGSPGGYRYTADHLKGENPKEIIDYLNLLGSSTAYDMVSDRDERDISFALPAVTGLLFHDNPEVRAMAIKVISAAGGEHNIEFTAPALIEVLLDKKLNNIHKSASGILRTLIGKGIDISNDVPRIIDLFNRDPSGDLRKDVVLVLRKSVEEGYELKNERSLLNKLLEDEVEEVKFGAADTLAYFYGMRGMWDDLNILMEHNDKDVRQEAAGTVEKIKHEYDVSPIFPKLKSLLKDENKEVRFVAARTLLKKYKHSDDIKEAIPLMAEFTSDPEYNIAINAFSIISHWIGDNIRCKHTIPKSEWGLIQPFIQVFETPKNQRSKKTRQYIVAPLTQYYVHTNQWERIKNLLKKGTNKDIEDILFRLTTCGYSNCKVDVSPLVPDLLELYFKHKNKNIRDYALRKIEEIVKPKNASTLLKEIQKYDINKRWDLEKKLREKIRWQSVRALKNKYDNDTAEKLFTHYVPFLSHTDGMIREWASEEMWNFIYNKETFIGDAITIIIKSLEDEDVFVRQISASLLTGVSERFDVSEAIPSLSKLMFDDSDKVRNSAAATLHWLAEKKYEIKEAIPNLLQNVKHKNHDVNYFAAVAPRKYMKDQETATYVLEQIEKYKIDKKNPEIKRLITESKEFMGDINNSIEGLINQKKSLTKSDKLEKVLQMWNEHWGSELSLALINNLTEAIFRKRDLTSWVENLKIFFREAEKILAEKIQDPESIPSFPFHGYSHEQLKKIHQILKDSAEYAEQDEWDSIFDFN